MTTHSWGENPRGRWILEIHNDAYSKWASDAKFFKWSLELHGIQYDPNTQEYRESEKNVAPREAPVPPHFMAEPPTTEALPRPVTTTTEKTDTVEATTEYIPRGCVSKRSECTQEVAKCRTFTHRSVAKVFCR